MIEEQHATSSLAQARLRVSPSPFRDCSDAGESSQTPTPAWNLSVDYVLSTRICRATSIVEHFVPTIDGRIQPLSHL